MNLSLLVQGLIIGFVLAITGLFSAIYHMEIQTLDRITLIEASTRNIEESARNLQLRMGHLEQVLINYDHESAEKK